MSRDGPDGLVGMGVGVLEVSIDVDTTSDSHSGGVV